MTAIMYLLPSCPVPRHPYMLLRYMLPNALPTLIITAATDVGGMMLELAALSFLGFGAKPPTPEWGYMLNEGGG